MFCQEDIVATPRLENGFPRPSFKDLAAQPGHARLCKLFGEFVGGLGDGLFETATFRTLLAKTFNPPFLKTLKDGFQRAAVGVVNSLLQQPFGNHRRLPPADASVGRRGPGDWRIDAQGSASKTRHVLVETEKGEVA